MGRQLWRTVWRLLKKLKIELSHNLAILLLGMYVKKKNKTVIQNDPHTLVFTTVSFIIIKIQKQPRCPLTSEWLKKVWYI